MALVAWLVNLAAAISICQSQPARRQSGRESHSGPHCVLRSPAGLSLSEGSSRNARPHARDLHRVICLSVVPVTGSFPRSSFREVLKHQLLAAGSRLPFLHAGGVRGPAYTWLQAHLPPALNSQQDLWALHHCTFQLVIFVHSALTKIWLSDAHRTSVSQGNGGDGVVPGQRPPPRLKSSSSPLSMRWWQVFLPFKPTQALRIVDIF